MPQSKLTPEKIDFIINGTCQCIDKVLDIFIRYFATGEMPLNDAEEIVTSHDLWTDPEATLLALYLNMKHGGDIEAIKNLKNTVERFEKFFDKKYEDGYEFETFDFVVIVDKLILAQLEKMKTSCQKRLLRIDSHAAWIYEQLPIIDMANHERYDADDVMDIEKEYKFRFDNIFDDVEEIRRCSLVISRLRKLHDYGENFSFDRIFDYVRVIKKHMERYSDSRTPPEYVNDKYLEALKKGEMIIPDEFELHEWEREDIKDILFSSQMETCKNECAKSDEDTSAAHVASVSNSAMFNKEYFTMTHVEYLHKTCNGRQFEEISPGDMYLIVNLQHCPRNMKVRDKERSRVCHLIYFLGEMLPDVHRSGWRKNMLDHLDIPYSYYNKKYKNPEGGNQSRQDEKFIERLEELKDTYRELEKAA